MVWEAPTQVISTGLATEAETLAGTVDNKAVTPKGLKGAVNSKVAETITNGVTGIAPSQDAVFDALALKADKYAELDSDRLYDGVDLTTKFATEIAGYSDVWAWIKARITAVDYSGIHVGDYIPFLLGGTETIWAKVAGIDTYYRTGDTELGHHIDFISKDCMATAYKWNETDTNNGTAVNAAPWMVSALKASLDGLVTSLPAGLQAVIKDKRAFLETRYTSGSTLINSISNAWNNAGKLWVPTEYEIFGSINFGTKPFASGQAVQYPIFANSCKSRVKGKGHNGTRDTWWTATPYSGTATYCCTLATNGYSNVASTSTALCVPLCFRI